MKLNLGKNMPILKNNRLFMKYSEYLHSIDFKIDPLLWLLLSIISSAVIGITVFYTTKELLQLQEYYQLTFLASISAIDLMIGYPYFKAMQRISRIEEDLPDALRQMSDTLRSGGTYEYALREIANSITGPLKKELFEVLRKLDEGDNFENSLMSLSRNVDSKLVKRTVTIIIESVAAGAGLATILDEIAEDMRETHRLGVERKSRTMIQVIFMFTAGALVAPLIFGFVSTISKILIQAASNVASENIPKSIEALNIIQISIQVYIFVETVATALMISIMREGKVAKSIIYIPILMSIAYIAYLVAGFISASMVGVEL